MSSCIQDTWKSLKDKLPEDKSVFVLVPTRAYQQEFLNVVSQDPHTYNIVAISRTDRVVHMENFSLRVLVFEGGTEERQNACVTDLHLKMRGFHEPAVWMIDPVGVSVEVKLRLREICNTMRGSFNLLTL